MLEIGVLPLYLLDLLTRGVSYGIPGKPLLPCFHEILGPGIKSYWLKDFMEAGKERLTRDATRTEIQEIKRENARLKTLVAELSLQVARTKKTAAPGLE
ncbi:hypothetical protein ACFLVS_01215 [Chloroflexota bacterium]